MNRTELIEAVAGKADLSKAEVSRTLDALLGTITESLQNGERVALTGFGTFEVRERAARTGRNPQTGEEMQVAASRAPGFKAGKAFRDAIRS